MSIMRTGEEGSGYQKAGRTRKWNNLAPIQCHAKENNSSSLNNSFPRSIRISTSALPNPAEVFVPSGRSYAEQLEKFTVCLSAPSSLK